MPSSSEMSVRSVLTTPSRVLSAGVVFALMVAGCATMGEQAATSSEMQAVANKPLQTCQELAGTAGLAAPDIQAPSKAGRVVGGILMFPVASVFAILGDKNSAAGLMQLATSPDRIVTDRTRAEFAARARFIDPCLDVLETERRFGADDARLVAPLIAFGGVYAIAGDFPQADALYLRAATIAEENNAIEESPRMVEFLIELGDKYAAAGKSSRAGEMYRRAVAAAERNGVRDGSVVEIARWESIKTSNIARDFLAFLEQFPYSRFSKSAWSRFHELGALPEYGCLTNGFLAEYGQVAKYSDGSKWECKNGVWGRLP